MAKYGLSNGSTASDITRGTAWWAGLVAAITGGYAAIKGIFTTADAAKQYQAYESQITPDENVIHNDFINNNHIASLNQLNPIINADQVTYDQIKLAYDQGKASSQQLNQAKTTLDNAVNAKNVILADHNIPGNSNDVVNAANAHVHAVGSPPPQVDTGTFWKATSGAVGEVAHNPLAMIVIGALSAMGAVWATVRHRNRGGF